MFFRIDAPAKLNDPVFCTRKPSKEPLWKAYPVNVYLGMNPMQGAGVFVERLAGNESVISLPLSPV